MKILLPIADCRPRLRRRLRRGELPIVIGEAAVCHSPIANRKSQIENAFTMVEIAICLAIIGIALVAIIGVLPLGLNVQRDNREETVINQDATVFTEAIRGGARGLDDLANYVYAITNSWTRFNANGSVAGTNVNGYTFTNFFIAPGYYFSSGSPLTNGANIIGLLSTPEYTGTNGAPLATLFGNNGYSNHVVAYVRSVSGPAVEKPPQSPDSIIRQDSFSYRILCVNAPVATDTNAPSLYTTNLTTGLHELRLTFLWPQLPNGNVGPGRQTFRTLVAGQISQILTNSQWLYFYQPQSFTNLVATP
jgi:prepilin-type N-terminal cleavage/methylation domain-containing protein